MKVIGKYMEIENIMLNRKPRIKTNSVYVSLSAINSHATMCKTIEFKCRVRDCRRRCSPKGEDIQYILMERQPED